MKDTTVKIRLNKKQLSLWKRFVEVYQLDSLSSLIRESVKEKMEAKIGLQDNKR